MKEEGLPPRRAVLAADPDNGFRRLARSPGWPGEDAALEAVRVLDTTVASAQQRELVGFLELGPGEFAVANGGLYPDPNPTRRYWRATVALDDAVFIRLRRNPFHLYDATPPQLPDSPYGAIAPWLPEDASAEAEFERAAELYGRARREKWLSDLVAAFAAAMHAEHTLVLGADWPRERLELLLLVLPPALRPLLTFQTGALAPPPEPVPRLVLTPLKEPSSFAAEGIVWDHVLPRTRGAVPARSLELSGELIALAARASRLAAAHVAYDRFAENRDPAPASLRSEVERLLRFAYLSAARELGEAGAALGALAEWMRPGGAAAPTEAEELLVMLTTGTPPESVGSALVEGVSEGRLTPQLVATVMERFFEQRQSDPAAFGRFADTVRAMPSRGSGLPAGDPDVLKIRTMLLLLAGSRGDAHAVASAASGSVDHELIERLGGVAAWQDPAHPRTGAALLSLIELREPEHLSGVLEAFDGLRQDLSPAEGQLPLVEACVALLRWAFGRLPAERWPTALSLAEEGIALYDRVAVEGGLPPAPEVPGRSRRDGDTWRTELRGRRDADVFLGMLDVGPLAGCVVGFRAAETADALAAEALDRIHAGAQAEDGSEEGVHWGVALLDRARTGIVRVEHARMAIALVGDSARGGPGAVLSAYAAAYPDIAPWLLRDEEARKLLSEDDLAGVGGVALRLALEESAQRRDVAAVSAICERVRSARVQMGLAELGDGFREALEGLVQHLRSRTARPAFMAEVGALHRGLTNVLKDDALDVVRDVLRPYLPEHETFRPRAPLQLPVEEEQEPPPPSWLQQHKRKILLAASVLMGMLLGGVVAVIGLGAEFRSAGAAPIARTIPDALGIVPASDLRNLSRDEVEQMLTEARTHAAAGDWDAAVRVLAGVEISVRVPDSFSWDSLLARSALMEAYSRPAGDSLRMQLMALAYMRTTRALDAVVPGGAGTDLLHLMRAEVCIVGGLPCESSAIVRDLMIAERSPTREVAGRATVLLARWGSRPGSQP